jgi:hypothetical protein
MKKPAGLVEAGGFEDATMRRVYQQNETQSNFDLATAMAKYRVLVEIGIIRLLLAQRVRGMQILKAAGITYDHFEPDLGAIYLAVMEHPNGDLGDCLVLARRLLKAEGCWDESAASDDSYSSRWSTRRLATFASSRLYPLDDEADLNAMAGLALELVELSARMGVAA